MANMCLLDDALHRDFGYMNCWAQNILMGLAGGNSYRNQSKFKYMKVGQEPLYRDKRGRFDDNYC